MLLLMVGFPALVPSAVAFAAVESGCGTGGIPDQVASGASTASSAGGAQSITCSATGTDNTTSVVGSLATEIVNIFTVVVGAASIFMIIYGGFRYITSGGSSERVGSAKNTIIYAIVGLVIVGIAQTLVHFVLSKSGQVGTSSSL